MTNNGNNGAGTALAPIIDTDTGEIIEGPSASLQAEQLLHNISELAHLIEESDDIAATIALQTRAEAIQFLTRKIDLESDIKNKATLNVISARRRLGVLTMEMPSAQGQRSDMGTSPQVAGKLEALADMGITSQEVSKNETLAKLPDYALAAFVDEKQSEGYEITVGGVLEYAKHVLGKNGKRKPKTNRAGDLTRAHIFDFCQTPAYAIEPLLPYLDPLWLLWEPASGEGLMVDALGSNRVWGTDIGHSVAEQKQNFFEYEPEEWDALVTNPPYSIKYDWLRRCYDLGKPFALLLPVETLGAKTAQILFRTHGVQVLFMDQRINFKMPEKGFDGSGAQFPTAWFTWQLDLETDMVFAHVNPD